MAEIRPDLERAAARLGHAVMRLEAALARAQDVHALERERFLMALELAERERTEIVDVSLKAAFAVDETISELKDLIGE